MSNNPKMGENQRWQMLEHAAELKMGENQRWEMLQHAAGLKMGENQRWEMLQHTAGLKMTENQRREMLRGRQLPCVGIAKWRPRTIIAAAFSGEDNSSGPSR